MSKYQLLKDKLFIINEKLEMETAIQNKTLWDTSEFRQSLENEISLLDKKKEVIDQMSTEIEYQLNNN